MNWELLHTYLDETFDFFETMYTSGKNEEAEYTVHPLIKMSTAMVLQSIKYDSLNRFTIIFPRKLESALWVAAISSLYHIVASYKSGLNWEFEKDQRVLLNGCLVEYLEKEYIPSIDKTNIKIRCSKNNVMSINLDKIYSIQPSTSKQRLASMESVVGSFNSKKKKKQSPLSDILGIQLETSQNQCSVILVSGIRETDQFIRNNTLFGTALCDLFTWGKINAEGDVTRYSSINATPTCLIANDLYRVSRYLEIAQNKPSLIIVDGASTCVKDLQILDEDIIDRNIPCTVVSDVTESSELNHLLDRDFRFWHWNEKYSKSNFQGIYERSSSFYNFDQSLNNYGILEVVEENCEFVVINNVLEKIRLLERGIPFEHRQLHDFLARVFYLFLDLLRTVRVPEEGMLNMKSECG